MMRFYKILANSPWSMSTTYNILQKNPHNWLVFLVIPIGCTHRRVGGPHDAKVAGPLMAVMFRPDTTRPL